MAQEKREIEIKEALERNGLDKEKTVGSGQRIVEQAL